MKRLLVVSAAILVVVLVAIFFAKKVHYVDTNPAIAFAGEYFSKLKRGQVGDAWAMYNDDFRRKNGENWQEFLLGLNTKFGPATAFTLVDAKIAPNVHVVPEVACVLVHYQVSRSTLATEERLLVCPEKSGTQMAIAGHELIRLDTQQRIAAGMTVQEYEVFSIGTPRRSPETHTEDLEAAREAADEFYRRMSSEEYGAIWDAAHSDLKNAASRNELIGAFQQLNKKLGVCNAPTLVNTDYAVKDGEPFVGLVYSRKCEHGEVNEKLAWKIVDGKPLLRGYH